MAAISESLFIQIPAEQSRVFRFNLFCLPPWKKKYNTAIRERVNLRIELGELVCLPRLKKFHIPQNTV